MEKRASSKRVQRRAATEDILGAMPEDQVPSQWRSYYKRLIDMRSFLRRGKRNQLNAANEQNLRYGEHMADVGTNSYEKDLALSRVSSEQDALFEIGAALDRIQDGTFGKCELTGKPIEPERLEAIPWTRFSADAERHLEREGQIKTASLPQPQKIGRSSTSNRVGEEWNPEPQPKEDKEDSR